MIISRCGKQSLDKVAMPPLTASPFGSPEDRDHSIEDGPLFGSPEDRDHSGSPVQYPSEDQHDIADIVGALTYAIQHVNASDWDSAMKAVDKAQEIIERQMIPKTPKELGPDELGFAQGDPIERI